MPSLQPGQPINVGIVERLRFALRGAGAAGCEVAVADGPPGGLRQAGRHGFVLETQDLTRVSLTLRSVDDSPIAGQVIVEITPIADSGRRLTYDVTNVQAIGQREIPLLQVSLTDEGECCLTSLIGARRAPVAAGPDGGWEPGPRKGLAAAIVIDRSASMAWSFRDGMLDAIARGLLDAADQALSGTNARCFTYGAASEGQRWLQEVPPRKGSEPFDPRPELFSSGVRIPWQSIGEVNADFVFIVTDDPEPRPASQIEGASWVGFIRPSGPIPAEGLPQELRAQFASCQSAGRPVLVLPADQPDSVANAVNSWAVDQIRQSATSGEEFPR